MIKTLVGTPDPSDPVDVYRRAYRGTMVDVATVLRKSTRLVGSK